MKRWWSFLERSEKAAPAVEKSMDSMDSSTASPSESTASPSESLRADLVYIHSVALSDQPRQMLTSRVAGMWENVCANVELLRSEDGACESLVWHTHCTAPAGVAGGLKSLRALLQVASPVSSGLSSCSSRDCGAPVEASGSLICTRPRHAPFAKKCVVGQAHTRALHSHARVIYR